MSRKDDLKLLDDSDECRSCPTHVGYDGLERPIELCLGCWNIYIWKLAVEQIAY